MSSMAKSGKLEVAAKIVVYGFALCITAFLMVTSCIYVIDVSNMQANRDSVVMSVGTAVLAALLMWIVAKGMEKIKLKRLPLRGNDILFGMLFLVVMSACAWWIVNSAGLPEGDCKSVYEIAVRATNHDLLPIAPTGSYMSLWPFQSGLLLYFETVLRLIPGADYVTLQWLNLFFVGLALISGYFTVRRWFRSESAVTFWCLLTASFLPYYFYVNFVYGEAPSIGMMLFATWMLTEYLCRKKAVFGILAVWAATGAVMVRKNSLIFVIACVLVLGVLLWRNRQKGILVLLCFLVVVPWYVGSVCPQRFYEARAHNTMGEGVPAIAYIAMGLQDDGGNKPGWWNGYHANLFMEYDFQAEPVKEISKKNLQESLERLIGNPAYAFSFFKRKLVSQWCDQTYSCIYITSHLFGDRTEAARRIYEGDWNPKLQTFMNYHQSMMYIGGFLFCGEAATGYLRKRKAKQERLSNPCEDIIGCGENDCPEMALWKLVWLVTLIGGFLFSMFWEGSSRYVMPYCVMLIPYGAAGWAKVTEQITLTVRTRVGKGKKQESEGK